MKNNYRFLFNNYDIKKMNISYASPSFRLILNIKNEVNVCACAAVIGQFLAGGTKSV